MNDRAGLNLNSWIDFFSPSLVPLPPPLIRGINDQSHSPLTTHSPISLLVLGMCKIVDIPIQLLGS